MLSKTVRTMTMVLGVGVPLAGCAAFLPAHPNSFKTSRERVTIRMLAASELEKHVFPENDPDKLTYAEAYGKAFGIDLRSKALPLAAAASVAIGLAVDAIVAQVKVEATHYEAQFGETKGFSGFWRSQVAAIDVPSISSISVSTPGEGLDIGEYFYSVTALDRVGAETFPSSEEPIKVTTKGLVAIEWLQVTGAEKYRVYRRSVGRKAVYYEMTARGFVDKGEKGTNGEPPRYLVTRVERVEDVYKRDFNKPDFATRPDSSTKTVTMEKFAPGIVQNYFAVEVKRTVRIADKEETAFQLVVGFCPSADGQMFKVAPLLFWTPKAKAKVLADNWWTWVVPTTLFGKLVRRPGHEIDSIVDFQVEAVWRGSDQQLHSNTVAAVPMKFTSYSIAKAERLVAPWGPTASGWLLGIPISYNANGTIAEPERDADRTYGTFSIKVLVTEKDKSNAKQLLEQGATFLKDHKGDVIKGLTK